MNGYLDIIVFALIAVVLLWRLRSVLGERSDGDVPPFNKNVPAAVTKANIEAALASLPSHVIAQSPVNWASNLPNYDIVETATVHHRLTPFLALDPTFYPDDFIQKARKAFPAIVNAFAKGDKKTLEFLLSPSLYAAFAAQIDKRTTDHELYEVTVHDVKKALIVDADLDGTIASVTVDFTAEQSITHKDANGKVIGDDDGTREKTVDRWVFSKDLKSQDPKWILQKTQEID